MDNPLAPSFLFESQAESLATISLFFSSKLWKSEVDKVGPIELLRSYEPVPVAGNAEVSEVKRLYMVIFETKDDPLLGPIVVYIDGDTKEVPGRGIRM